MKIQLNRDYCGRIINDHVLLKGEHEVSETVGAYLVDKGYAVLVTPVASEPATFVTSVASSSSWTDVTPDDDDKPDAPVIHAPKRKR